MQKIVKIFICVFAVLGITACFSPHGSNTYTRSDMGRVQTVMKGKILSIRSVTISGTNSGVGAGSGAAIGATAGSGAGGSNDMNLIGAVGGAVAGGIAGAMAEKSLTEANAQEFIVEQDNGQVVAIVQINDEQLKVGDHVLILRARDARIIKDNTVR